MPCFESHVSLEFITDVADGLLLYSGPLAQLQTWDHEDFMAIGNNNDHPFILIFGDFDALWHSHTLHFGLRFWP